MQLILRIFTRFIMGGLLGWVLLPGHSSAVVGDCTTSNVNHGNTNGQKTYRINGASFDLIPTLTRDQGANAVIMGADRWNEQANAGHFVLGPTTDLERKDIPDDKATCDAKCINFSLVIVEDSDGPKATTYGKCKDADQKYTQFVIVIQTHDSAGNPWNWAVGDIGAGQWDLVQTMTHEFGHTMRLGHPANGEEPVMAPTTIGTTRKRDLYQWDLKCAYEISGHRHLTAYRRYHTSGSFGSESAWTSTWNVADVSAGRTKYTGTWDWSSSART